MNSRQKEAGLASREVTRRRLVDAAAEVFLEQGYRSTTVTLLARRAGVSLQTLYLAVGGKSALLRLVLEGALRGSAGPIDESYVDGLRVRLAQLTGGSDDPRDTLRGIAGVYRGVAERAAPWWRLYRDAAVTEEEIARDWATLGELRRTTLARLLDAIPDSALRPGLGRDEAVDTLWALASPETHDLLVRDTGYSLDRYERWVANTVIGALLR